MGVCHRSLLLLDQWCGSDYRYFKPVSDDKGIYILRHSMKDDYWERAMFDCGKREATRLSST